MCAETHTLITDIRSPLLQTCNSIKYVYLQIPEEQFSVVTFHLSQKEIVLVAR